MSEPIFLTLDEVMRIHARSLAEHGGADGVRDSGMIESALGSAKNTLKNLWQRCFAIWLKALTEMKRP